jgi:hypothetical protein
VRGIDVNTSAAKATSRLRIRRRRAGVILLVVLLLLSVFIVPPLEQEQHLHATPNEVLLVTLTDSAVRADDSAAVQS